MSNKYKTLQNIFINADDFGISIEVNNAIVKAWELGLLDSTTIMANMPGFCDAIEIIKSGKIPSNRIGIHLNLFEGKPLTDSMKECRVFCNDDGIFNMRPIPFFAPARYSMIVYEELRAQIIKVLNAGINITHIDSHAHRHFNWFIGKEVIKLAKDYNIRYIRISGNLSKFSLPKLLFQKVYNARLGKYQYSDYFYNIPNAIKNLSSFILNHKLEVMCHPSFNNVHELVDIEFNKSLELLLKPFCTIANKN